VPGWSRCKGRAQPIGCDARTGYPPCPIPAVSAGCPPWTVRPRGRPGLRGTQITHLDASADKYRKATRRTEHFGGSGAGSNSHGWDRSAAPPLERGAIASLSGPVMAPTEEPARQSGRPEACSGTSVSRRDSKKALVVELRGLEPLASCMPCSGNTSTVVHLCRSPSQDVPLSPPESRPVAVLSCCTPLSATRR
jgi:hypothetical protein